MIHGEISRRDIRAHAFAGAATGGSQRQNFLNFPSAIFRAGVLKTPALNVRLFLFPVAQPQPQRTKSEKRERSRLRPGDEIVAEHIKADEFHTQIRRGTGRTERVLHLRRMRTGAEKIRAVAARRLIEPRQIGCAINGKKCLRREQGVETAVAQRVIAEQIQIPRGTRRRGGTVGQAVERGAEAERLVKLVGFFFP